MSGLSGNGLHVLADDVKVSALPITKLGSDSEHVASITDAETRPVRKMDGEVKRSVVDGVSDEVHHFAMDFWIFSAQPRLPLLAAPFDFSAFHRSYREHAST